MATLLQVLMIAYFTMPVLVHSFNAGEPSFCFAMTPSCNDDSCQCSCDRFDSFEISCPTVNRTIDIQFEPRNYARIECKTIYEEYQKLPYMKIGSIDRVLVKGCKMPLSSSFKAVLDRLGIQNVRSLSVANDNKDFSNGLIRDHFTGFIDITRLSISAPGLTELPEDFFTEVANVTWLELKNFKIQKMKAALSQLQRLENLEVTGTGLIQLEEATFEHLTNLRALGLWANKLEAIAQNDFLGLSNLRQLDLLSNRISTFHPDAFVPLPNLTNISLNNNRFNALPVGLFRANKELQNIKMIFNNISELPAQLLANIPTLLNVDLSNSGIVIVPADLFANSSAITHISLPNNKLETLPAELFQYQTSLEELNLQHNLLSNMSRDLLVNCRNLRRLDLSFNAIETLPRSFFQSLINLEELHLSDNRLVGFSDPTFQTTVNLRVLNLANNKLVFDSYGNDEIPDSPFHRLTALTRLLLRNNSIELIHRDFIHVMTKLEELDLSHNNITSVSYLQLQFHGNGVRVNLSNNQITLIDFDYFEDLTFAQGGPPTKPPFVSFDSNPLNCDCRLFTFYKFLKNRRASDYLLVRGADLLCDQPENLKSKPVFRVTPTDLVCEFDHEPHTNQSCPTDCTCGYRTADRSLMVNCSGIGLRAIPDLPVASKLNALYTVLYADNNLLEALPTEATVGYAEVQKLYVSHNNISVVPADSILANLSVLDVSFNNIRMLDVSTLIKMNMSANLRALSLSNNPWRCDCEMRDLLFFMQSNYERIADYTSIGCPNGDMVLKLSPGDICPQELQSIIVLSVILAALGIIMGLVAALYYKYQENVKIWMYWHNIMPFIFNRDVLDVNKKYDAFISYSHKDEDFVADQLMPELEQKRRFNLCIHRRDWTPGDFIPEQIQRSVSDSRRTIIVLSPNYVESLWGKMEFRTAHRSALEEQVTRVIVIVYGKVDRESLDPELKGYIDMNTYIEWGDPWFWERLHYALRTVKMAKKEKGLQKAAQIKGSVDDKLELINPLPVTPPLTTPPAEHPMNGDAGVGLYKNGNALNGHVNGAFIINTNSKQSDV